ncbi:ADP-ribosylation factor-like protein 8 [Enteropsectra breve]|nr:ADP-ribosylation factor-like protein 8 [Enteropsectra breve]
MGNIQSLFKKSFTDLFEGLRGRKKASLAILGLDNAGKTALVNLFRQTNLPTQPTLGLNFEEVVVCNTTIKIWDVGGQNEFISYWKDYVKAIDGLIFMVDIADSHRFENSYAGFKNLVPFLKDGMPVMLMLNKIDLLMNRPDELERNIAMVREKFRTDGASPGLDSCIKVDDKLFKVRVQETSIINDLAKMDKEANSWTVDSSSVYPGLKWLLDVVKAG